MSQPFPVAPLGVQGRFLPSKVLPGAPAFVTGPLDSVVAFMRAHDPVDATALAGAYASRSLSAAVDMARSVLLGPRPQSEREVTIDKVVERITQHNEALSLFPLTLKDPEFKAGLGALKREANQESLVEALREAKASLSHAPGVLALLGRAGQLAALRERNTQGVTKELQLKAGISLAEFKSMLVDVSRDDGGRPAVLFARDLATRLTQTGVAAVQASLVGATAWAARGQVTLGPRAAHVPVSWLFGAASAAWMALPLREQFVHGGVQAVTDLDKQAKHGRLAGYDRADAVGDAFANSARDWYHMGKEAKAPLSTELNGTLVQQMDVLAANVTALNAAVNATMQAVSEATDVVLEELTQHGGSVQSRAQRFEGKRAVQASQNAANDHALRYMSERQLLSHQASLGSEIAKEYYAIYAQSREEVEKRYEGKTFGSAKEREDTIHAATRVSADAEASKHDHLSKYHSDHLSRHAPVHVSHAVNAADFCTRQSVRLAQHMNMFSAVAFESGHNATATKISAVGSVQMASFYEQFVADFDTLAPGAKTVLLAGGGISVALPVGFGIVFGGLYLLYKFLGKAICQVASAIALSLRTLVAQCRAHLTSTHSEGSRDLRLKILGLIEFELKSDWAANTVATNDVKLLEAHGLKALTSSPEAARQALLLAQEPDGARKMTPVQMAQEEVPKRVAAIEERRRRLAAMTGLLAESQALLRRQQGKTEAKAGTKTAASGSPFDATRAATVTMRGTTPVVHRAPGAHGPLPSAAAAEIPRAAASRRPAQTARAREAREAADLLDAGGDLEFEEAETELHEEVVSQKKAGNMNNVATLQKAQAILERAKQAREEDAKASAFKTGGAEPSALFQKFMSLGGRLGQRPQRSAARRP